MLCYNIVVTLLYNFKNRHPTVAILEFGEGECPNIKNSFVARINARFKMNTFSKHFYHVSF